MMTNITDKAPIILDTHVILWSLIEPEQLSDEVKNIISNAQEDNRLFLSSISLWEIAMLKLKKRINIYQQVKQFLNAIEDIDGLRILDLTATIAAESTLLTDGFHGDPADRIIVASAIDKSACLVTRDNQILSWADNGHIRVIKA